MHTFIEFMKSSLLISALTGARYLFFAGLAWLLGYVLFKKLWARRKIIQRDPETAQIWREIQFSALTLLIFGAVGALSYQVIRTGHSQMYFNIGEYGWGWFFASIVLSILLHDTYFYWTHRWMHHRRLFKLFHRVHHQSINPTPWAAYCFSPFEAVVQAGIFPLVAFSIPIHPLAFLTFMIYQITMNVVGHTGYEFYPRSLMDSWLGKIVNTPTNHIMHHEHIRGNFGLYFNCWDRMMGTNHENYENRFREVSARAEKPSEARPVKSSTGIA